ncbi:hypothetical protein [Reichenbachiella sp.]|uniref:hypothetical protein n=1 Tax=Reichenbachiella sp. TaxID=2184521 RepID=UPI00329A66BC
MNDFNNEKKPLRGAFPRSYQDIKEVRSSSASSKLFENPAQHYAIASDDEIIKRFKLVLRSGEVYSVPYSLLPVFMLLGGKELIIKAYGVHVTIKGRNLNPIEEYLSNEMLLWIKESPSGKDDGKINVYVSDILIQGKAMKYSEDIQNDET